VRTRRNGEKDSPALGASGVEFIDENGECPVARSRTSLTSGLDTINAVVRALESLGIEFTNGEAIGVRLRPKPSKGKK
jgi:hypothetical protein